MTATPPASPPLPPPADDDDDGDDGDDGDAFEDAPSAAPMASPSLATPRAASPLLDPAPPFDDHLDPSHDDLASRTSPTPPLDPVTAPPPTDQDDPPPTSPLANDIPDTPPLSTDVAVPAAPLPLPLKSVFTSVTAHFGAGSNPALSSSGGEGSPSISGAVWRSSSSSAAARALEDVDLGEGNILAGAGPRPHTANGTPSHSRNDSAPLPVPDAVRVLDGHASAHGSAHASEGGESSASDPSESSSSPSLQNGSQTTASSSSSSTPAVRDSFVRLRTAGEKSDPSKVDWEFWGQVMADYEGVARAHPQELSRAIQQGIPPALRGMTWQLMAASKDASLEATYRELLKTTSSHEKSIGRDLSRTFPRHEFFREGGRGQTNLFNVVKAYSLYDDEVGYTQGLQFIVGPLLLNMPEEEAFCVLVRLMQSYDLRSHYTPNMPGLQLRLFQFDRLLEELLPALFMHLLRQGVKSSMYGSQWFLTLYGYRFPLELVSVVFDLVFAEGVEAVFRFAIAILKRNEQALLELEFEHLIEFLKNGLFEAYAPDLDDDEGLYRADEFVKDALSVRIQPAMLDQFGEEWTTLTRAQTAHTAEIETLRRANAQLSAQVRSLEGSLAQINIEHCDLVRQVVNARLEREELEDELVKYKTAFADLSHRQAAEGATSTQRGSFSFGNPF